MPPPTVAEVKGSHAIYVSNPEAVAALIERAATGARFSAYYFTAFAETPSRTLRETPPGAGSVRPETSSP